MAQQDRGLRQSHCILVITAQEASVSERNIKKEQVSVYNNELPFHC